MWRKLSRMLFLLLLLLLLTASTPTSGGRTGEGDAINTGQGEEPPPPQGRGGPLPVTPLLSRTESNVTQGRAQSQGTAPNLPRASQSSTSLQFFHSSSSHHTHVGVTKDPAPQGPPQPPLTSYTTPTGAPQGQTEEGNPFNLPPSSPLPPLRPLWPDPPPSTPPPTPPTERPPTLPVPQRISQSRQEASNGRRKHRRVFKAADDVTSDGGGDLPPTQRGDTPGSPGLPSGTSSEEAFGEVDSGQHEALWTAKDERYARRGKGSAEDMKEASGGTSRVAGLWSTTEHPSLASPSLPLSASNGNRHEELADFPSEWVLEGESTGEASEELADTQSMGTERAGGGHVGGPEDADHQEITPFPGDSTEGVNDTRAGAAPPVDLDTLELELAGKEEEATNEMLLAISILQHHFVPDGATNQSLNSTDGMGSRFRFTTNSANGRGRPTLSPRRKANKFNVEIFDALSHDSDEVVGKVAEAATQPAPPEQQQVKPSSRAPGGASRYRWFVLVLDGNCSVIKQRMTAFVTFLKAALSSKLSVDYDDVFVPSVFCDKTFMVNISLDTLKNPDVERRLRTLAEANTTLLEISQEIFYLEKILTKKSEEEKQHVPATVKKPDDMELVIYMAVGCMCVFILLSVVVVVLIRVCRQEGDHLDLGKPHLHQIIPRTLDFPIRRPNVIYSQRFSQALTPGKCGRHMEEEAPAGGGGGVGGVAVVAVGGAGRGSYLRYDPEIGGCGGDLYSIGTMSDDPYHDRRALVPARKRITHIPGEDVILEEDLIEEEDEDEDEDEEDVEDEDDDDVDVDDDDDEVVEDMRRRRRRRRNLAEDEAEILAEEEAVEEEIVRSQTAASREAIRPISTAGSNSIVRTVLGKGRRVGEVCRARGAAGLAGVGLGTTRGQRGVFSGLDNPCYNR